MNVLEFDSVEKSFFGRKILSSIHMQCATGNVVALLGRNGTGKSTLFQIVFGSLDGDYQSVRLNKQPLLSNKNRMARIGYLPQGHLLPRSLKVQDALHDFKIKSDSLIEFQSTFSNLLQHQARQLSGGLERLLETFLIIKSKKPFVLLDEPFSGIMPVYVDALKALITEEKSNKGIIISDHMYQHALDVADQVYLLRDAKTYFIKERKELVFRGYLNS
jgi:ABC-type lipopolysaccharide export system ATPase subunit